MCFISLFDIITVIPAPEVSDPKIFYEFLHLLLILLLLILMISEPFLPMVLVHFYQWQIYFH